MLLPLLLQLLLLALAAPIAAAAAAAATAAAAAAAAAAASTTAAVDFLRLFTFRTGKAIVTGYSMCTYVRRTWVLILPCAVFIVFIVAPCNAARVCALACFTVVDLDGRQCI